jgi:hypothetical protein
MPTIALVDDDPLGRHRRRVCLDDREARRSRALRTPRSGPLERFRVGVVCSFCKASICLRLNARKQTEVANVYNIADTGAR